MSISTNFNYRNVDVSSMMANGEAKLGKAMQNAQEMASRISSKAEKIADKVMNFNGDDLKKLEKKLEKFSDKAVAKMKEMAISTLHKLDEITDGAIKKFCKDVDLPFPQKSVSGQAKDFAKEVLGKETYNEFAKFGKEVNTGFRNFMSEAQAGLHAYKGKLETFKFW